MTVCSSVWRCNSFAEKRGERVSRSKAKISSKSNFLSVSGYSLHLWEVLCVHFTEGKQRPEWVGWTRALWVPRNVSRAHTHRFLEPNLFLWTFASSIAAHVKSWDPWADEILRTELKCHNFKISFQFFGEITFVPQCCNDQAQNYTQTKSKLLWLHKPQQATLQEPQRNMTSKKTESLVQSNDTIWEQLNIQKTVQSSNIHMRTLKSPKKECPQKTVKSNNPCKHLWEIWACRT